MEKQDVTKTQGSCNDLKSQINQILGNEPLDSTQIELLSGYIETLKSEQSNRSGGVR